jgi:hypothetical protein
MEINKNFLDAEICRVSSLAKTGRLGLKEFKKLTGISKSRILRFYDSWNDACKANGIKADVGALHFKKNPAISKDACREEILRVANLISPRPLTRKLFAEHSNISTTPIKRLWAGSLKKAFLECGVKLSENIFEATPFEELANEFLLVATELKRVPSLVQLRRRSKHGTYSFQSKHGGYDSFKAKAIGFLLEHERTGPLKVLFENELVRLNGNTNRSNLELRPHEHGRMLGFRAFACVPTYEQDVVGMFTAIAHEIGFEIISNRNAFPDCKANRKIEGSARNRYKECLIEFELRSSDFKAHKHPVNGCDLIVCWEHDWKDCPLEVLELKKAIQSLSGWRDN